MVRPHVSQHDAIGDLPLVTRRARVTAVEAMDEDRGKETRAVVESVFERAGVDASIDSKTPPERLGELATSELLADEARRVHTVLDRLGRDRPMLVRTEFETDETLEYLAGQYVGLRYDGTSRAYSLSSSPTQNTLEICVRRVIEIRAHTPAFP